MDFDVAIEKHAEWKFTLRSAIVNKQSIDAVKLGRDDACELGKWLHGSAKTNLGRHDAYTDVVKQHAVFHKAAAEIATAINRQQYDKANALLASGTDYYNASLNVTKAIRKLRMQSN